MPVLDSAQGWGAEKASVASYGAQHPTHLWGSCAAFAAAFVATNYLKHEIDRALFFSRANPVGLVIACAGAVGLGFALWLLLHHVRGRGVATTAAGAFSYLFSAQVLTSALPHYLGAPVAVYGALHWLLWVFFAGGALRQRDGALATMLLLALIPVARDIAGGELAVSALALSQPALLSIATWRVPFDLTARGTAALRAVAAIVVVISISLALPEALLGYTRVNVPLIAVTGLSAVAFAAGELVPAFRVSRLPGPVQPERVTPLRIITIGCSVLLAILTVVLAMQLQMSAD